jgi:kynureninase
MQLEPSFIPREGADGWQVSNPPILAMAPLRASLALFDAAGMPALREKAKHMTAYLRYLLERTPPGFFETITPHALTDRGCQTSLLIHDRPECNARDLMKALEEAGIVCDFREPKVIRVAPVPLYNTYHEVWTFAGVVSKFFYDRYDDPVFSDEPEGS